MIFEFIESAFLTFIYSCGIIGSVIIFWALAELLSFEINSKSESKYIGIKDKCCIDENIEKYLPNDYKTNFFQCKTCLKLFGVLN